ncbi:hypothetical protein ACWF94_27590, partial [Streptomyces sp. NPDC055078]
DLVIVAVDLRVTDLLDGPAGEPVTVPGGPAARAVPGDEPQGGVRSGAAGESPVGGRPVTPDGPAAVAAATAPGVAHLTATLGSALHLASDHVRVEVATAAGHRPLDVVRAVRQAVTAALGDGRPVSVLVTALGV